MNEAWGLYKIKVDHCKIGTAANLKEKIVNTHFEGLQKEIAIVSGKPDKNESLRKLMRKFIELLL